MYSNDIRRVLEEGHAMATCRVPNGHWNCIGMAFGLYSKCASRVLDRVLDRYRMSIRSVVGGY